MGSTNPGWMHVLEQSTSNVGAGGVLGSSQTPRTPCFALGTQVCAEHPVVHGAPWASSSAVVAQSAKHLKSFAISGLILLPLELPCLHFPSIATICCF